MDVVGLGRSGSTPVLREQVSENTTNDKGPVRAAALWRNDQVGHSHHGRIQRRAHDLRGRATACSGRTSVAGKSSPIGTPTATAFPTTLEINGIHDGSGNELTGLPAMGANPCRGTIAVEVDYMVGSGHTQKPAQD
ncbi:MAG: hypothetical protein U5Q44_08705 [Dehalococcoidia bacterium]|nr:hypothetical protein [Dehalococcoidia bacterium]